MSKEEGSILKLETCGEEAGGYCSALMELKEKYSPTLMEGDIGPLPQGALGLVEETLALPSRSSQTDGEDSCPMPLEKS